MKKLLTTLLTISTLSFGPVIADTLELADGTLLEGSFVGSSNGIVMFNTGSSIEAFPEGEVAGIFLSSGVARTGAAVGLGASLLTSGQSINVPAGTILETRLRVALTLPGQ